MTISTTFFPVSPQTHAETTIMPIRFQDFGYRDKRLSSSLWGILVAIMLGVSFLIIQNSEIPNFFEKFFLKGEKLSPSNTINFSGLVSGFVFFGSFFLYLARYYDKIWSRYFSLESDFLTLGVISVFFGLMFASLIIWAPQMWFLGVFIAFVVMILFKWQRTAKYKNYFVHSKFDPNSIPEEKMNLEINERIDLAKYNLATSLTRNFLWFSFISFVVFILPISIGWGLVFSDYAPMLGSGGFTFASIQFSLLASFFFIAKAHSGLSSMVDRIESGDHEYFTHVLR